MALIIETGSIVNGANSYATAAEFDLYLSDRGLAVSQSESEKEALLINASDNLLSYERRYLGVRVNAAQTLSWPRTEAYIHGFLFDYTSIPDDIKKAQMQLAYESISTAIDTNATGREVIEQEVPGVIKQKFKDGTANKQPKFGKVEKLLSPILKPRSFRATR